MKGGSEKHCRPVKVYAKALWQQQMANLRDGHKGSRALYKITATEFAGDNTPQGSGPGQRFYFLSLEKPWAFKKKSNMVEFVL